MFGAGLRWAGRGWVGWGGVGRRGREGRSLSPPDASAGPPAWGRTVWEGEAATRNESATALARDFGYQFLHVGYPTHMLSAGRRMGDETGLLTAYYLLHTTYYILLTTDY